MGSESKKEWYVKTDGGSVYGPADVSSLVAWAEDGRIGPSDALSKNRIDWTSAQLLPELGLEWLVQVNLGEVLGPFNRKFLIASQRAGHFPPNARVFSLHHGLVDEDPPPKVVVRLVPVEQSSRAEQATVVEAEVVGQEEPASAQAATSRGVFGGHDREKLAALEVAAQRELAVAGRQRFGFLGRKT